MNAVYDFDSEIDVQPGGRYTSIDTSSAVVQVSAPADYPIEGTTTVTGGNYAYAIAHNTLRVTK